MFEFEQFLLRNTEAASSWWPLAAVTSSVKSLMTFYTKIVTYWLLLSSTLEARSVEIDLIFL
jgi:hypothetical protein